MTIDAHHHLWNYSPADYPWIGDGMTALRRDFTANDWRRSAGVAGIGGAVVVQARQSLVETDWLLGIARRHDFVRGVVGWVPLADENVERHLARLSAEPKLCGVRHVLQDEPDDAHMLRPEFRRGLALLQKYGLAYDLLIFPRHLRNAARLADEFPAQTFVLDHLAKPSVRTGEIAGWARDLRELSRRQNVACKLSGLVTEAKPEGWTEMELRPYLETALAAFGPERLMFGTDWPVCLVAAPFARWTEVVRRFIARLSADEQLAIMGGTARRTYGLALTAGN